MILNINLSAIFPSKKLKYNLKQELCIPAQIPPTFKVTPLLGQCNLPVDSLTVSLIEFVSGSLHDVQQSIIQISLEGFGQDGRCWQATTKNGQLRGMIPIAGQSLSTW